MASSGLARSAFLLVLSLLTPGFLLQVRTRPGAQWQATPAPRSSILGECFP